MRYSVLFIFLILSICIFPLLSSAQPAELRDLLMVRDLLVDAYQCQEKEWCPEYARENVQWFFDNLALDKIKIVLVVSSIEAVETESIMGVTNDPPTIYISPKNLERFAYKDFDMENGPKLLRNLFLIALIHEVEHFRGSKKAGGCLSKVEEEMRVWYIVNELLVRDMIENKVLIPDDLYLANCIITNHGTKSPEYREFIMGRTPCD